MVKRLDYLASWIDLPCQRYQGGTPPVMTGHPTREQIADCTYLCRETCNHALGLQSTGVQADSWVHATHDMLTCYVHDGLGQLGNVRQCCTWVYMLYDMSHMSSRAASIPKPASSSRQGV